MIPVCHAELPEPAAAASLNNERWSFAFHAGGHGLNRVDDPRTGNNDTDRHAVHPAAANGSSADHAMGYLRDAIQNRLYLLRHGRHNQNGIPRHLDLFNPFLNHLHQILNPRWMSVISPSKSPSPASMCGTAWA